MGSVVTENPKGGIAENFKRIQRGASQLLDCSIACLKNGDVCVCVCVCVCVRGAGNRESYQNLLGGSLQ